MPAIFFINTTDHLPTSIGKRVALRPPTLRAWIVRPRRVSPRVPTAGARRTGTTTSAAVTVAPHARPRPLRAGTMNSYRTWRDEWRPSNHERVLPLAMVIDWRMLGSTRPYSAWQVDIWTAPKVH